MKISKVVISSLHLLDKKVTEFGNPYVSFGIFGVINYLADFPWLLLYSHTIDDPSFMRHTISFFACVLLIFAKYWPQKIKLLLPIYLYGCLFYMVSYITAYSFLENYNDKIAWLNGMLGLFILILIVDWVSFIILLMLGVGVAYIQYRFFEHRPLISLQDVSVPLYTFVFTILAGILFSRNIARNRLNRQLEGQLSTIRTVCASIAHELRTPLLAIKSGAAGIKHFLPRLLETYKIAQEHNLKIPEIREGHLNSMTQVMNNIDSEVDFSNDVITSLLTNAMHNNVSLNPKLRYDIASTVKAALLRYHFNPASQIEVVHFDESNNFEYHADEILVTHIIFNLLKNAIYAIEEMRKGEIFITLAHEKNYNCLYFRDTAKGMSKETQSNLFQAFYTEKPNNTGIGLAFSKMVMDNLGGEIAVNSVLGEYAEFVLHFPIVKDSAKG